MIATRKKNGLISSRLFDYYKEYKGYGPDSEFDRPFEPCDAIIGLFDSTGYDRYALRLMDIDNDGMDEIIGERMYWPSSAHQNFGYNLRALKKGAEYTFCLKTLLVGQDELLHVFPVSYNGKNYFLTLQPFGDSQYIFKLQEIANGTTYMLAVWIVSSEDQVHATIEDYVGNWW